MSDPSAQDIIEAFTGAVRDELESGRDVDLPLLGTLRVEHRPSEMTEEENSRSFSPPRNAVVFEPDRG